MDNQTPQTPNTGAKSYSSYAETLSNREKTAGIFWLVIGILQVLTIFYPPAIVLGIFNLVAAKSRFRQAELVRKPWQGMVAAYDQWQSRLILSLVLNIIFGGVYGIAAVIYDMVCVRNYVMENKAIFEELAANPDAVDATCAEPQTTPNDSGAPNAPDVDAATIVNLNETNAPEGAKNNKLDLICFVLGLAGTILTTISCCSYGFASLLPLGCAIAALIVGSKYKKQALELSTMYKAGNILGIVAIVLNVLTVLFWIIYFIIAIVGGIASSSSDISYYM